MAKFGILGYGFMGKKHYDAICSIPDSKVTVIIDNKNTNPETENFQSLEVFLEHKRDVDVIIIATPNSDHYHSAAKLIRAGYHIFLEKPYCLTDKESKLLQQLAEENHTKIFFSKQNRYAPTSKFLKKIIEQELLGSIYMVQVNLFWSRNEDYYRSAVWKGTKQDDGGTLYTQFFHFIDLIHWVFGDFKIENVLAKTFRHNGYVEIEDTGAFNFQLQKGGGIGVVNFTTAVYEKNLESSMTIIGENGTVKISGQYFDKLDYCNIKGLAEDISLENSDNMSNLRQNLESVFEPYDVEDLADHFKTVHIIEEIYKQLK